MSNEHSTEVFGGQIQAVREGLISGCTFADKSVRFSVIENLAVFEGDILLGVADAIPAGPPTKAEGLVVSGRRFRWPGRTIPYTVDPAIPKPERISAAIEHWKSTTPMCFVQRTNEADYVAFRWHADSCSSYVGRQGGSQILYLADWGTVGSAIHEIGHAVGLWHEQSREDRDRFVTIVWDNIEPGTEHNFQQHVVDGDDVGSYDYDSIMHYGAYAFAKDPSKRTIIAPKPIGLREALSAGDVAAVRAIYPS